MQSTRKQCVLLEKGCCRIFTLCPNISQVITSTLVKMTKLGSFGERTEVAAELLFFWAITAHDLHARQNK